MGCEAKTTFLDEAGEGAATGLEEEATKTAVFFDGRELEGAEEEGAGAERFLDDLDEVAAALMRSSMEGRVASSGASSS